MVGSNVVVGPFVHTRCRMGNLATTSHLCSSSSRSHNQEQWEDPSRNNNNNNLEACNNHNQVLHPPRNNHSPHPPHQTHNLHNKPLHLHNRIPHNNSNNNPPVTTTKVTPRYVPWKIQRERAHQTADILLQPAFIGSLLLHSIESSLI